MSGGAIELVDLVARWIHVIAAIMWAGNSMLFNWLDRNLRPASPETSGSPGSKGTLGNIWLLHSGAFYFVEKTLLGGQPLPRPLHWFKWQAYTTWWSGVVLLIVVYYFGGRATLADVAVAPLGHRTAVLVALAAIAGGWALYESMQRFVAPRAPRVALAIWITGLTAIAIAVTHLLSGRASFLHVGAMLGTIMAANVVFTIVPSQRELVAAVSEGRGADPAVSARAKRVSIHNNYFTFPVIVLMVISHFPAVYGSRLNWLLVLVLIAAGAAVRHLLNIRFTFPAWRPVLAGTLVGSVLALIAILRFGSAANTVGASDSSAPVTFTEARRVIDRRCAACHSAEPSDVTFGVAPGGVRFDTPEQILAHVARIRERAVATRTMPPGNKTNITEVERAILRRWIAQGAVTR
ncbi:MAG: urate hydroxylase PuuD [Gemmatimonadota bacterium]|nr:urate hydroxylase PuuD [Gemmatimonadota bacterium]